MKSHVQFYSNKQVFYSNKQVKVHIRWCCEKVVGGFLCSRVDPIENNLHSA